MEFIGAIEKKSGYMYEAANLILEEAGYPKVYKVLSVRRLFRNLNANKQDCSILAGTDFVKEKLQLIEKIRKKIPIYCQLRRSS